MLTSVLASWVLESALSSEAGGGQGARGQGPGQPHAGAGWTLDSGASSFLKGHLQTTTLSSAAILVKANALPLHLTSLFATQSPKKSLSKRAHRRSQKRHEARGCLRPSVPSVTPSLLLPQGVLAMNVQMPLRCDWFSQPYSSSMHLPVLIQTDNAASSDKMFYLRFILSSQVWVDLYQR